MIIEAGEWLPDMPDLGNPGAITANNCYPVASSYRALKDIAVYSSALGERPLASFPAKSTDLNTHMFAGTASYLYKLGTDLTFSNVSKAGNYSSATRWNFTQYGNRVIAVSLADNLQSYVLGSSSLFANLTSDLKADYVASSETFVIVGNTYDTSDGSVPHRVRWCAIDDPTDWTVAAATQADYQDLNSTYGEVTGLVFVGDFYAFQEKAITRLQYVGSPLVFSVDTFETSRGTKYPGSIASNGSQIFYLAEDGFYMLRYSESVPIGADKINKTFFADLHVNYTDRIRATIDPINNLVMWAYPSNDGAGNLDKLLIYNWAVNRWSIADGYTFTHLGRLTSLGYTLEGLDAIGTNIDAFAVSLDSRAWKGGEESLMAFNTDWKMCSFTGDTLTATIDTREMQPIEGRRSILNRVRALVDGTATVKIGTRQSQSDTVVWSDAYSAESDGTIPTRENNNYIRGRIITSGDYTHIQGLEVLEVEDGGTR